MSGISIPSRWIKPVFYFKVDLPRRGLALILPGRYRLKKVWHWRDYSYSLATLGPGCNNRLIKPCPGGGIGRRAGFRCQWPKGRGSSSLLLGTICHWNVCILCANRSGGVQNDVQSILIYPCSFWHLSLCQASSSSRSVLCFVGFIFTKSLKWTFTLFGNSCEDIFCSISRNVNKITSI